MAAERVSEPKFRTEVYSRMGFRRIECCMCVCVCVVLSIAIIILYFVFKHFLHA